MFDLTNRVVLVTGAGQGIGAGIARVLAAHGASVAVNDLRAQRAEAVATSIGAGAVAVPFDVTDLDAVDAGVAEVADRLGTVSILVNNAGNAGAGDMELVKFRDSDPAAWKPIIDVNLFGALHCTRAVLNPMVEAGWGRVVTIASTAGVFGAGVGVAPYAAAKGGAIAFMRHIALENARRGVTANTVALGLMDTVDPDLGLTGGQPGDSASRPAPGIPVGRLGTPADAAALCLYLVSPEASWMTGQTLNLNGGIVTT